MKKIHNYKEFWLFYVREHSNGTCRRLHIAGTALALLAFFLFILTKEIMFLILMPLFGYSFAWIGHFYFQKNKPATFKQPFFSLISDFVMFCYVLTGKFDTELIKAFDQQPSQIVKD